MSNRHILEGGGELITAGQKDRAKLNLREETISLLKLRLETDPHSRACEEIAS